MAKTANRVSLPYALFLFLFLFVFLSVEMASVWSPRRARARSRPYLVS